MKVFLDDVRATPDGWVRAYTPEEVVELLRSGQVEVISLDFDLGFRGEEERRTGEVVLQWIEEKVFLGEADFTVPEIRIHSSNPVGRQRLERALGSNTRRRELA
jgi:hypothetical protein